jgi:hypothetical protein
VVEITPNLGHALQQLRSPSPKPLRILSMIANAFEFGEKMERFKGMRRAGGSGSTRFVYMLTDIE